METPVRTLSEHSTREVGEVGVEGFRAIGV